jgi:conjugal transfer/entry exclusion protein
MGSKRTKAVDNASCVKGTISQEKPPAGPSVPQSVENLKEQIEQPSVGDVPPSPDHVLSALDRLPIRRRAVVKALTSPDSPTYGNQTQSYRGVYGNTTAGSAAATASIALRQPSTALAIREEIEKQGLGVEVRIGAIKEVLRNRHQAHSRTTTKKQDDGSIVVDSTHSPRAQDVLKAVALLDKMDGSDSARQAEARVKADTLRELTKRIMGSMDAKHGKGSKGAPTGQGEGIGGKA